MSRACQRYGPGRQQRGERLEAELVVAAAIEDDAPAHAGQVALGRRTGLELDDLAGRRVGRGEVLDARQRQPDRALEAHARGGRQRLGDHQLAAEGAAQRRRAHAHAVVRPAEQVGQLLARAEGALRARADHEPALGLQPRGGHLRLHVALVDPARAEAPGGARGRRRPAPPPRRPAVMRWRPATLSDSSSSSAARVAAARRGVRAADVGAVALDDVDPGPRRARRHRRLEVQRGLERLDVDDDLVDAVGRRGLGLGHHQRHGLAGVDDLRARQRLAGASRGAVDEGQVGRGEHRDDARHLERRRAVDARDPPVRLGGEARAARAAGRGQGRRPRRTASAAVPLRPLPDA